MRRRLVSVCLLVALVTFSATEVDCGCAAVDRCCQGKDNSCLGSVDNAVEPSTSGADRNKKSCFCDSACLDLGDCCADYSQHCPAQDCVLADEWLPWTDCSVRCGIGTKHRNRRILRSPRNGGRPCDATVQKAICYGTNCKHTRAHNSIEMREMATLLPASLGQWRRSKLYNPNLDIRKNLFEKQNDLQSSLNRPSYCAVYELTHVKSSCALKSSSATSEPWTYNMTRGMHVCAECQPAAMQAKLGGRCKGAGLHRRETQWMALGEGVSGCHGSWIMKTKQEECRCSDDRMLNLILV